MILIDNLKKIRNFNFISKFNLGLDSYKYILVCDSTSFVDLHNLKSITLKKDVKFFFLKKFKTVNFKINNNINNSVVLYCTNNSETLSFLISTLKKNILFLKLNNNYYSINDITNINSFSELINYLDNYLFNFISILDNINIKKKCI